MFKKRQEVLLKEKKGFEGRRDISLEVYLKDNRYKVISVYDNLTYGCIEGDFDDYTYSFEIDELDIYKRENDLVFTLKGKKKEFRSNTYNLHVEEFCIPEDEFSEQEYQDFKSDLIKLSCVKKVKDYYSNKESNHTFPSDRHIKEGNIIIKIDKGMTVDKYRNFLSTVTEEVATVLRNKGESESLEFYNEVMIHNLTDYEFKTVYLALVDTKFKFMTETLEKAI